jgi:hypothetical protein
MRILGVVVVAMACVTPAFSQTPQQQDDLQPGVNTSAMPPAPVAPPVAAAPAVSKPTNSAPAPAATAAKAGTPAAKAGKAQDRMALDTTQITGNKELPKVMYVVPWKKSDLGDLTGKPANSLVDEVLQPVDRDVFNREERYYHTVAPQKSPSPPPAGAPADH